MRTLAPLAMLACILLAGHPAPAQKNDSHVHRAPGPIDRQGGDTIADATVVPAIFSDTGSTYGYTDDYDEVCPYSGSTAPDVVYTFTPTADMAADIDMLGSDYDTKIYLYDADLNLVACNDDYYPDYVSKIENVDLQAGMQYYLVIDGYGGDFGNYVVTVCEFLPCAFACHPDAVLENEPELVDGYVDAYNGGCDADPPVFQPLTLPPGESELIFCGRSGWYDTGGIQRDSDWLEMVAAGEQITIDVHAPYTFAIEADVLFLQDCQNVSVLPYDLGTCMSDLIQVPTTPGQMVHLRVRPLSPTPAPCSTSPDIYELRITGIDGVVATQPWSWSAVKELYR